MQKKAIIAIVVVVIVALVGIKLLAYWSRQAAERAELQASLTETTAIATPIEITAPQAPAIEAALPATEATAQEAAVSATESFQATSTIDTSSISLLPRDVKEVQIALKNAGFDPGLIDGKLGRRTKAAIKDFQTANNLSADGKVGPKTWSKLSKFLTHGTSVEQPVEKFN